MASRKTVGRGTGLRAPSPPSADRLAVAGRLRIASIRAYRANGPAHGPCGGFGAKPQSGVAAALAGQTKIRRQVQAGADRRGRGPVGAQRRKRAGVVALGQPAALVVTNKVMMEIAWGRKLKQFLK